MKNIILALFCLSCFQLTSQDKTINVTSKSNTDTKVVSEKVVENADIEQEEQINWMSWEEAYEANKTEKRKIFIDIYTHWCGWCKKMDKSTFLDKSVVEELNKNFYAVKFDAEQKNSIMFNEAEFKFASQGRRGAHQLAYALLDGRMGYPAFVMLDENFNRIMISPGYKKPEQLLPQLGYTSTEAYKEKNFTDFEKGL